jgi:hypothetical protein
MQMRFGFTIVAAAFAFAGAAAAPALAANEQGAVTDAAVCATIEGWNAFLAQWNIDFMGALTAGTLTPEVHQYISDRVDVLTNALSPKATPAERIRFCEDLNVLFPR